MANKQTNKQARTRLAKVNFMFQEIGKFPKTLLQDIQQVKSLFILLKDFSDSKHHPENSKFWSVKDFQNGPANYTSSNFQ